MSSQSAGHFRVVLEIFSLGLVDLTTPQSRIKCHPAMAWNDDRIDLR
jgi:hypothetical protein